MFVGHYAVAFALKGKEKKASLGMLFLATQFVDILFFPLAVLGIEKLNFVNGITEVNNFDLAFMPYTHGLLASVFWSVLVYFLYVRFGDKTDGNGKKVGLVMGLAVLSHWFADLIAHTPDLPLIYGEPKVGFGLWQSKIATFLTEAILLIISVGYYLNKTKANSQVGKYAAGVFVFFLILIAYVNYYQMPQGENLVELTVSALLSYFLLAAIAWWVDKKRT